MAAFLCALCYGLLWVTLYSIRVHELQIELIEVSFNVYTLQHWVEVLVDKHKIRIDLETAIFAENNAHLVAFLSIGIGLRD